MRLFLIRHGETDWNRDGRFQGQRDTALSDKGRWQAQKAASGLALHKFQGIVSSPLSRALDTAREISALGSRNIEVDIIDEFTEINHGDWEGLLTSDVREHWDGLLAQWHIEPERVRMPGDGGETLEEVCKRAVAGVEKIAAKYSGDVAATSHDAVIKALLCYYLGAPLSSFWRFQIANCSLTIIEFSEGRPPRVSLMGDAHYLGEGFEKAEQKAL